MVERAYPEHDTRRPEKAAVPRDLTAFKIVGIARGGESLMVAQSGNY